MGWVSRNIGLIVQVSVSGCVSELTVFRSCQHKNVRTKAIIITNKGMCFEFSGCVASIRHFPFTKNLILALLETNSFASENGYDVRPNRSWKL